ncbi:large ribosomal RNA subunit accumulation protein YCED homolog 1, chloroplastic [Vicia villosa]|uniref:large ribosomal RNA subunit accumulation protein YCED homolog 1, chloroplastic n=1 Tax=Vicia villosa TaxID=3911 RepID=UPI00273BF6BE|nr:large ribosomal RNA subunit accumulation protein YCED homolog 1, chloroplastic [Vicia villosa]
MPLLAPSSSATPFCFSQLKTHNSNSQTTFSSNSLTPFRNRTVPLRNTPHIASHFTHKFSSKCNGHDDDSYTDEYTMSLDWDDEDEIEDDEKKIEDPESPWEGAVIYKRNALILHQEYCTTLERLGLGRISTDISKNKASVMGLRVAKTVKDYPNGTPVQVSVDVTRKKKKLRLDGIIKTVITLPCNRCGRPFGEGIFSEFSLLLTDEPPVDEPETNDLGVIFGVDKISTLGKSEEDDEDALIDPDDQLHFPREEKQIDISKNIRDRVHVKINIGSVCDSGCKGMCMKCGKNLNTGNCSCSKEVVKEEIFGPFRNLREKMQMKRS